MKNEEIVCARRDANQFQINEELIMSTHKLSGPAAGAVKAAAIIAAVIIVYLLICSSTGIVYRRFMKDSEKIARIPGLGDGFIPQGVCYSEAIGAWLCCGYTTDGSPSRLYVIGEDGKVAKMLLLQRENGDVYTGHAGGVSSSGEHIWISNAKKAFHLTASAVEAAGDGDSLAFDGYFGVGVNASFTFADDNYFWIGEYHSGDKYQTADSNHMTTPDGSEHGAIIYGYELDDSARFGVDPDSPVIALSVRDIVQGFCVTDSGKYVLSTSAGAASSHLYIYDCTGKPSTGSISYGGKDVPLYCLDSEVLVDAVKMPHMSEDLDYHDGKVCIAFEAGAHKYGGGLIPFSLKHIMGFELD